MTETDTTRMERRRRYCPVCWRSILPNRVQDIEGHWDNSGRTLCPGSYEPYRIAQFGRKPAA
jgi:hypothetical protein